MSNVKIFEDGKWKDAEDMGLCEIHDYISKDIEDVLENLDLLHYESEIKRLDTCLDLLKIAKQKGQSMEDRLKDYRRAIERLGFKRVEGSEIFD